MCELFGMSSHHQTTVNLSLTLLAERGENPRLHGDGWGVAYYENNDVRLIKDAGAAKGSPWVDFIKRMEIKSHDVIAHIRKSTIGEVSYRNTHPFVRELYGRMHTFAHNGTLPDVYSNEKFKTRLYRPVGTTDSELAFCLLMEKMSDIWKTPDIMPDFQTRLDTFNSFVQEIREIGPLNILYSDGEVIFAHGHRRHNPITDKIETPGLYYTQVFCADYEQKIFETYESGVTLHGRNNLITLFASVPLSDRNWRPVQEGEIFAVKRGQIVYRSSQDQLSA